MDFEQWLEKEYPQTFENKDSHGIKDWVEFAKVAFEAGRQNLDGYRLVVMQADDDLPRKIYKTPK